MSIDKTKASRVRGLFVFYNAIKTKWQIHVRFDLQSPPNLPLVYISNLLLGSGKGEELNIDSYVC